MNYQPGLFIYRNTDKSRIAHIMNNINWEPNNDSTDLAKQDSYTMKQLQAMQLVAKMKEAADKMGAGFVGGFIDETGRRFMMSNVEQDDIQHQTILRKLQELQDDKDLSFKAFQNSIKVIEDGDGFQIVVEPE